MRLLICMVLASIALFDGIGSRAAELNPVRTHPAPSDFDPQRFIVKFRASSTHTTTGRVATVITRSGLKLQESRQITGDMHAIHVSPAVVGESVAATLARLRADPEVEFAEQDQRRYPHALPNDPLYSGQWYMQKSAATPSAVDAATAWDTTTGSTVPGPTNNLSTGIVIADLDTGVRFEHPDLLWAGGGGRLLPGYDFIDDSRTANDGDGRDADPSDPGDWVSAADAQQAPFKGNTCIPAGEDHVDSSWHGTRTAGMLGALTNNGVGIAGMTWSGWILPVRVLGKCGGFDSDIMAGMLWSAGVHVAGIPDNPYPARIENMSLGAVGTCTAAYQGVINQLTALGVLIVVSAGNEGGPVDAPGNCTGVAAVAGLRHAGTKVGFSSLGPQIAVGAPAGNCINTTINAQSPCVYSIGTTTNTGTTAPAENGYTDNVVSTNLGTSFAAPIVSGIAALMLATNGNLKSAQLIARLKEGSAPYPQTSLGAATPPPACHVPANSSDIQSLECICTLDGQTCGAGMASASGAVGAALRPIAAVKLTSGANVALDASGSAAACNHSVSTYQWVSSDPAAHPITNPNGPSATVAAAAGPSFTVTLTVKDDAGRQDVATVLVAPAGATSTAPTAAGAAACPAAIAVKSPIVVSISPTTASVLVGTGTQAFSATVTHTLDTAVTWEVDGFAGGNATVGTISTSGVYTAPATVPSPSTVMVEAVSAEDQTEMSSTNVTLTSPESPHSGGGALDPFSLLVEAVVLGAGLVSRRYARRCAASSQVRCARR